MKRDEAAALIQNPVFNGPEPQTWCDLGCGNGFFTVALAEALVRGSKIFAVDFDQKSLSSVPEEHHGVAIHKILGDLRSPGLRLPSVDGVLMANCLHFIEEQHVLLRKLLSVTNHFLVVEYETSKSSHWGPYPVGFERLCKLFRQSGVERVEKLATLRSRFGGTIYSAMAKQLR